MAGPWEKYTASAQGPWSKYPAERKDAEPSTGAGEAALEHYGNAATLGYLPHIQAGVEKLTPDPNADTDALLREQGFTIDQPEQSYLASRDANLKRLELEGKEHPVASGIGTGLGVGAGALIPAGQAIKGASLGEKAFQGAGLGAAYGAASNPGDVEGEIDRLQLGGRFKGGLIGAAVGGAMPVAIDKATGAAKGAFKYLRGKEASLAENAVGATGKQSEKFLPGTGRQLRKKGVVNFGSSPANIADNASAIMDKAEASKADIIKNKLSGVTVDRNAVYNAIKAKINALKGDESQLGLIRALEDKADDVLAVADQHSVNVPIEKSEGIRKGFDKASKWDSAVASDVRDANKAAAGAYRDAGEAALIAADSELGNTFVKNKADQRLLIPVRDAAEKRAAQLKQSPIGGLLDVAAAGAGGGIGALIDGKEGAGAGSVLGLLAKGMRPRYASIGSAAAGSGAKLAGRAASSLSKINPNVASFIAQRTGRSPKLERDPDADSVLKNPQLMDIFRKDPSRIDAIQDDKIRNLVRRAIIQRGRSPGSGK